MKRFKYESSSTFRGVSWNPDAGKFEARIAVDKSHYFLGLFDDDISAAIVYDVWAKRLGVPRRSNRAAERYGAEQPVVGSRAPEPCSVCEDRGQIRALRRLDGDWIEDDFIPCPKCQDQT